jgi:hypothetical protein
MIFKEFPRHGKVLFGRLSIKPLQLGKKKWFVKTHALATAPPIIFDGILSASIT